MHLLTHALVGGALWYFFGWPAAFLGSVLPDISLIGHEWTFRKQSRPYGSFIKNRNAFWYRAMHSVFWPLILFAFSPSLTLGWLIHILMDYVSHQHYLEPQPFYPIGPRWNQKIGRVAVLVSGGWDSVYSVLRVSKIFDDAKPIFFNYGQPYYYEELSAIGYLNTILRRLHVPESIVRQVKIGAMDEKGVFPNRNETFIRAVVAMG